jgi:hypothetical protein
MTDNHQAREIPPELLEPLLSQIALPVENDRLLEALQLHARTHDALMLVRAIRFPYTPTYVEPLTALRWIENGGRSVD